MHVEICLLRDLRHSLGPFFFRLSALIVFSNRFLGIYPSICTYRFACCAISLIGRLYAYLVYELVLVSAISVLDLPLQYMHREICCARSLNSLGIYPCTERVACCPRSLNSLVLIFFQLSVSRNLPLSMHIQICLLRDVA